MKLDNMKLFIETFLSLKPKKHLNLKRASSCLEADSQILLICRLKLSWSSMRLLKLRFLSKIV